MMKNNITFEFKSGMIFIKIKYKINIINFVKIVSDINKVIIQNKFKFVVFDLRNEKNFYLLYLILLKYLRIIISKYSGSIIIIGFNKNKLINKKKYYNVKNESSAYEVFSMIS